MTDEQLSEIEARQDIPALIEEVRNRGQRLAEAKIQIRNLLLSADAMWEEQRMGHDWAESCKEARAFIRSESGK